MTTGGVPAEDVPAYQRSTNTASAHLLEYVRDVAARHGHQVTPRHACQLAKAASAAAEFMEANYPEGRP